jgi:hypothetical protein
MIFKSRIGGLAIQFCYLIAFYAIALAWLEKSCAQLV